MVSYILNEKESLGLFNTNISGTIPATISNCQKLEVFKVENCRLTGDGLMALYDIPTLKVLGVAGNSELTGTLLGIDRLPNLEELYLSDTKMNGPLPEEMGNLSQLRIIKSDRTQFTGGIPASFGNLVNLEEIAFNMNLFTVSMPSISLLWFSIF